MTAKTLAMVLFFLLTTIDLSSTDDALDCIKWYCLRWRIEDWHRVLKSGCGVEALAHKTAEWLEWAIAINQVMLVFWEWFVGKGQDVAHPTFAVSG